MNNFLERKYSEIYKFPIKNEIIANLEVHEVYLTLSVLFCLIIRHTIFPGDFFLNLKLFKIK